MADLQQGADIALLALVVWREARGQSPAAQLAVAYTVMNRVGNPGWWGHDVLSVVGHPEQYDSMTHKGDPNLTEYPAGSDAPTWLSALNAATLAYHRSAADPTVGADTFYDVSIAPPYWTEDAHHCVRIGTLDFWRVGMPK